MTRSAWKLAAALVVLFSLDAYGQNFTTTITAPVASDTSVATVEGTAEVDAGDINEVQVQIESVSLGMCWDVAGFPAPGFSIPCGLEPSWFGADPVTPAASVSWESALAVAALNGQTGDYTIRARGKDNSNNVDPAPAEVSVTLGGGGGGGGGDPPTSIVMVPEHNSSRLTTTVISGIASPAPPFSTTISTVHVRVQDLTTGDYWNGTNGFGGTEIWSTATLTGPATWSQTFGASLTFGRSYNVVSKAFDSAASTQTAFDVGLASVTFTASDAAPSTATVTALNATSASAAWAITYGATGYTLIASVNAANPPTTFVSSQPVSGEATTVGTLTGLTPNTTYSFFVQAGGPEAASLYNRFATSATLANLPVSAATAGVGSSSASLSWSANSNPGGTLYQAQASIDPAFGSVAGSSATVATAATITGLAQNTTYYLRVRAVNHGGTGTAYTSNVSSATDAAAPVTPAATADSSTQITLTWGANSNPAGTRYTAQRSTAADFTGTLTSMSVTVTNAVFTSLTAATTYYLRVRTDAHNGSTTAFSSTVSTCTAAAAAAPSTGMSGTVKDANGQSINLVPVELRTAAGALAGQTNTDAAGAWSFTGLTPAVSHTVIATYTVNNVGYAISQSGHLTGATGISLVINSTVTLATITGNVTAPLGSSRAAGKYGTASTGGSTVVEVFQNGRKVGTATTDLAGNFTIPNVLPGRYSLRSYNGSSYSDMTTVDVAEGQTAAVVFAAELLPEAKVYAYPNPARNTTTIRFESPVSPLQAQVLVFDLAGALVRELAGADSTRAGSEVSWNWDLTNSRGQAIASGVYLVQVKVVDPATGRRATVTKKLAVVR